MKRTFAFLSWMLAAMLMSGCNLVEIVKNIKTIHASDTVVSETRQVNAFSAIEMRALGKVVISQGEMESLAVAGSDNIVPLVKTSICNGMLIIEIEDNINVIGMDSANMLTFTLVVKDLNALTVSGLAQVQMNTLSTSDLSLTMSGAGRLNLNQLAADNLNVTVSGLGKVTLVGETTTAEVEISGAGGVSAPDLKIKTATVNVPGLGSATMWVTDQLNGTISGAGNVSYYGDPQKYFTTTGLGTFKSLGSR